MAGPIKELGLKFTISIVVVINLMIGEPWEGVGYANFRSGGNTISKRITLVAEPISKRIRTEPTIKKSSSWP